MHVVRKCGSRNQMHVGRKGGLYLDCLRRQLRWRTRHDTAARMVHSSDHAENVPLQLGLPHHFHFDVASFKLQVDDACFCLRLVC